MDPRRAEAAEAAAIASGSRDGRGRRSRHDLSRLGRAAARRASVADGRATGRLLARPRLAAREDSALRRLLLDDLATWSLEGRVGAHQPETSGLSQALSRGESVWWMCGTEEKSRGLVEKLQFKTQNG